MNRLISLVLSLLIGQTLFAQCSIKFDYIVLDSTQGDCSHLFFKYAISGGTAAGFEWDYGDGNTCSCIHPKNFYNSKGTFDVCAKVRDANGCRDSMCIKVDINCQNPCDLSEIGIYSWDTMQMECGEYEFIAITSKNVKDLKWTFGDGDSTDESYHIHQYKSNGSYPVRLLVRDSINCADTADFVIDVNCIIEKYCDLEITGVDTTYSESNCKGMNFNLKTNKAANKVYWFFGDGNQKTGGAQELYFYEDTGIYDLMVIAETADECRDTVTKTIRIVCDNETSLDVPANYLLKFYPNPFEDILNIEASGVAELQLMDFRGQVLLKQNVSDDSTSLDLSDLQSGIYVLSLNQAGRIFYYKVQKL